MKTFQTTCPDCGSDTIFEEGSYCQRVGLIGLLEDPKGDVTNFLGGLTGMTREVAGYYCAECQFESPELIPFLPPTSA